MAVALEKLLAVKAFVLGSAASNSHSKDAALSMVSTAIEILSSDRDDVNVKVRLAFYHLLRAEILRHDGNPVPDRDAARHICVSVNSSLYLWFMTLEEVTTSRSREIGRERLLSAYGSISRPAESDVPKNLSRVEWRDFALRCLSEDPSSLTEHDKRFLDRVTLKSMLRKHGIGNAP